MTFAAEKIGPILTFKLTNQEGQRLTAMMLAMRPDWVRNNPGQLLEQANQTGLPGHDFPHSIRALATYATAVCDDGKPQYRTPNLFIQDGKYWTDTAPKRWVKPKAPRCEDHPDYPGPTCPGCWGDYRAGDRPQTHIGKHYKAPANAGALSLEETE